MKHGRWILRAESMLASTGTILDGAVLADRIETSEDNFTRFFAIARRGDEAVLRRIDAAHTSGPLKTSLVYTTRNVPGALTRSP